MRNRARTALVLTALAGLLALPGVAGAQAPTGPAGGMGVEVRSFDPATRTLVGVAHCTSPELAGKEVTLTVGAGVDVTVFSPGAMVGVVVDASKIVTMAKPMPPCGGGPGGPGPGGPGPGGPGGGPGGPGGGCGPGGPPSGGPGGPPSGGPSGPPSGGPGPTTAKAVAPGGPPSGGPGGPPSGGPGGGCGGERGGEYKKGFLNRVWTILGESNGFDAGVLNITLEKILNLPKKMADQDDNLVDQDAYVVISKTTKVYDKAGEEVDKGAFNKVLDKAKNVKVRGKLMPEAKWSKDEDDQPVPTIRAKKVYISG